VLIPAFFGLDSPDLATTAVLHLGTLVAVVAYFRKELWSLTRFRSDPDARHLLTLMVIGTLPTALALLVVDQVSELQRSVTATAVFLMVTGLVLAAAARVSNGNRRIGNATWVDAVLMGFAQLVAVLPGISRSGFTISTAVARRFDKVEAARFSFVLGVPAVTGAGLLELGTLLSEGGVSRAAWVGVAVAALTGYLAIAFFLRLLNRTGLGMYAIYCLVVGILALLVL
jgi:undecaprenyl-diphosphatase